MGFISDIGALQEEVTPDPDLPITTESLVAQYEMQAKRACVAKGWPEDSWRMLAECWAGVDLDIIRDVMAATGSTPQEALKRLCGMGPKE
jgi:hypothetical protein